MSPAERKIMTEFLLQYREYTCLWKTSDKHYRNREKRTQAMKHLAKILQKYDETADIQTVSKKINNYRTTFKKEYNKVLHKRLHYIIQIYCTANIFPSVFLSIYILLHTCKAIR